MQTVQDSYRKSKILDAEIETAQMYLRYALGRKSANGAWDDCFRALDSLPEDGPKGGYRADLKKTLGEGKWPKIQAGIDLFEEAIGPSFPFEEMKRPRPGERRP